MRVTRTRYQIVSIVVALFMASLHATPAQEPLPTEAPRARPILWRIERDPPAHLFATIHVVDRRLAELPEPVLEVLKSSDTLVTEGPQATSDVRQIRARMSLPAGERLQQHLPPDVVVLLDRWAEICSTPPAALHTLQPWAVLTQVPLLGCDPRDLATPSVDLQLHAEATRLDKPCFALEDLDEHLGTLSDLPGEHVVAMLRGTLEAYTQHPERARSGLDDLVLAYLSGSLESYAEATQPDGSVPAATHEFVVERMITDRNERFARRIGHLLFDRPDESLLFAVGVGHFAEDGLVAILRRRGLTVTRVQD